MAYSSTNPPVAIMDSGITGAVWKYTSSDVSSDIATVVGSTDANNPIGYFRAVGAGSRGGSGIGMKLGEAVLCQASSLAVIPFEAVWMTVIASTPNVLSTIAASGYSAAYDVSVGTGTNSTST